MLSQVSIFAENKKGRLQNITSLLQKENINIWGSITNDSAEYGIIRMVVSNPEHAEKVLAEAGYLCRLTEVLGVELDDEVGALNRLLISLEESNINVVTCISPSIVILASRLWCFTRTSEGGQHLPDIEGI